MKNKGYILILFAAAMGMSNTGLAQMDSIVKASWILDDTTLTQEIRTKRARELVDKSMNHTDAINSSYAWFTRGIIYKEWYKIFEKQDKKSKARLDAVAFFKIALTTDTSKGKPISIKTNIEYKGEKIVITDVYNIANVKLALKYLGSTFQNDAAKLLPEGVSTIDTSVINFAIKNYELFKECMMMAEPTYNFKPFEINFKTVLADQYAKIFISDIKINVSFYGMAENLYKQVIALDTNNWAGNYNLAMLYYNYGVNIINAMTTNMDSIPFVFVPDITENAKIQHQKALPYALKSYKLNPKRWEVPHCLSGIYWNLYEHEKSEEYKVKAALLEKGK